MLSGVPCASQGRITRRDCSTSSTATFAAAGRGGRVFQPIGIKRAGTVGVEIRQRLGAACIPADTCNPLEELNLGVVLGPLAHNPVGVHLLGYQDDGGVLNNLFVELADAKPSGCSPLDEFVARVRA